MLDGDSVRRLRRLIDFPSTRSYIENILARMEFYKRRGEFAEQD